MTGKELIELARRLSEWRTVCRDCGKMCRETKRSVSDNLEFFCEHCEKHLTTEGIDFKRISTTCKIIC
jgi:hypothetical protein